MRKVLMVILVLVVALALTGGAALAFTDANTPITLDEETTEDVRVVDAGCCQIFIESGATATINIYCCDCNKTSDSNYNEKVIVNKNDDDSPTVIIDNSHDNIHNKDDDKIHNNGNGNNGNNTQNNQGQKNGNNGNNNGNKKE